jgi:hypothetical protein
MLNKITSYLSLILLGAGAILYPKWLAEGYLYEWYPRIGAFVAIYGGLIANIAYLYKTRKK